MHIDNQERNTSEPKLRIEFPRLDNRPLRDVIQEPESHSLGHNIKGVEMKSVKENVVELGYSIQKEICSRIREMNIDFLSDRWFCLNCGTEQNSKECTVCRMNEYLVPDNESTQRLLESQEMFDNLKQVIRDGVKDALESTRRSDN